MRAKRKRYDTGTATVPKPGDTVTTGSWDPNAGTNSTGQSIRKSLGMGVPRPGYSDGTERVEDMAAKRGSLTTGYSRGSSCVDSGMERAMGEHADKMHPVGRR